MSHLCTALALALLLLGGKAFAQTSAPEPSSGPTQQETLEPTPPALILQRAAATAERLRHEAASWTVCFNEDAALHFEAQVSARPGIQLVELYACGESQRHWRMSLFMTADKWILKDSRGLSCALPWETDLPMASALHYIMTAKPQVLTPQRQAALGRFTGETAAGIINFRQPLSPSAKARLQQNIILTETRLQKALADTQLASAVAPLEKELSLLRQQLKSGLPQQLNAHSGLVTLLQLDAFSVRHRDLTFLNSQQFQARLDTAGFTAAAIAELQAPLPAPPETDSRLILACNPQWTPGAPIQENSLDARLLALDSSRKVLSIRRLPFEGAMAIPFAASPDGSKIYVAGQLPGQLCYSPWEIDLAKPSPRCRRLGGPSFGSGQNFIREMSLSPDGSKLALINVPDALKPAEAFVCILDLKDDESLSLVRLPLATLAWTHDNLLLATRPPAKPGEGPCVVSILADGSVRTLVKNACYPALIPGSQGRILHQSTQGEWLSCASDGSDSQACKEMDRRMQFPAFSPDGRKICILSAGKQDEPMPLLWSFRDGSPRKVSLPPGLYLHPVLP